MAGGQAAGRRYRRAGVALRMLYGMATAGGISFAKPGTAQTCRQAGPEGMDCHLTTPATHVVRLRMAAGGRGGAGQEARLAGSGSQAGGGRAYAE